MVDPRKPKERATRWSRERGAALIEFAFVLPLLLLLTVAAVDFGRAFFAKNVIEQSAQEGVRSFAVRSDTATVRSRVLQVANASGVTISKVQMDGPTNNHVSVTVDGEFDWIFPGVFNLFGAGFTNPMTLTGRAVMYYE